MKYYVAKNSQPDGPYELNELIERGLTMDSLLWNETLPGWTRASYIPEVANFLQVSTPQPIPPIPPQPGRQYGYQQYPNQPYQQPTAPMPNTYMVGAILVTLFCCVPFGVVAIVKSSQVSSCYNRGDYNGALKSSNEAKNWIIWGVVTSFILGILYLLFIFVALASR